MGYIALPRTYREYWIYVIGPTPTLLKQVFIISCQVDENTFVPCLYAMIPDKKRDSYDTLFSMSVKKRTQPCTVLWFIRIVE